MCVNISSIKRIFSNQSHFFPDIPCIYNRKLFVESKEADGRKWRTDRERNMLIILFIDMINNLQYLTFSLLCWSRLSLKWNFMSCHVMLWTSSLLTVSFLHLFQPLSPNHVRTSYAVTDLLYNNLMGSHYVTTYYVAYNWLQLLWTWGWSSTDRNMSSS